MKRIFLLASAAGAVLVASRLAKGRGAFDCGSWIARMPDDAPPKWMFNNITAIRSNTERILELMERQADGGSTSANDDPARTADV